MRLEPFMLSGYPRAGFYSALGSLSSSSAWWVQSGDHEFNPLMARGMDEDSTPCSLPGPRPDERDDRLTPIRYDGEWMLRGWNSTMEEPFLVAVE
jgi:hypothetical protein